MLRGFINFLNDYLDETGVVGLLKALLGILAFASLLSAVFGTAAIKAGALIIATLCLIGALVLLSAHHQTLRKQADQHRRLLTHYCWLLTYQMDHMWQIHRWSESITIEPNGDVSGTITVHATVETEVLHFFRVMLGAGWKQPERMRQKVRVAMASVEVTGTGRTRWDETTYWRPDGRLEILAHCISYPPRKGDDISLHLDLTWPGKAAPLMRFDKADDFVTLFGRPLAHLSYRVALPVGTKVTCDAIGLTGQDDFNLSHFAGNHRQPVVELIAHDIEADRRVGMRLDLK
jgi:hypothetical protein